MIGFECVTFCNIIYFSLFILCYNMRMTTPWNKIKAEYLQGVPPRELAIKYNISANTIHNKFSLDGTTKKAREIQSSLQDEIREKIEKASSKVIDRLFEIVGDSDATNSDVVAAARAILDVSGLKSQKVEATVTELPVIKDDI